MPCRPGPAAARAGHCPPAHTTPARKTRTHQPTSPACTQGNNINRTQARSQPPHPHTGQENSAQGSWLTHVRLGAAQHDAPQQGAQGKQARHALLLVAALQQAAPHRAVIDGLECQKLQQACRGGGGGQ